ncbi:MAG: TMEM165/GDT1 family protein [Chloroflexi bacterium]|nr:TMEM165/GDT1 family protein [Chloroflexota bacterium]
MLPFLAAVALAFGAIFVAEFGDKSQLLILAFATRYAWRPVVLGVVVAAVVISGHQRRHRGGHRQRAPRDGGRDRLRGRVSARRRMDAARRG